MLAADRLATLRVETAPELRPLRDRVDGAAETLGEEEAARALYLLTKIGMEMPRLHRRVCNALPDAGNWR